MSKFCLSRSEQVFCYYQVVNTSRGVRLLDPVQYTESSVTSTTQPRTRGVPRYVCTPVRMYTKAYCSGRCFRLRLASEVNDCCAATNLRGGGLWSASTPPLLWCRNQFVMDNQYVLDHMCDELLLNAIRRLELMRRDDTREPRNLHRQGHMCWGGGGSATTERYSWGCDHCFLAFLVSLLAVQKKSQRSPILSRWPSPRVRQTKPVRGAHNSTQRKPTGAMVPAAETDACRRSPAASCKRLREEPSPQKKSGGIETHNKTLNPLKGRGRGWPAYYGRTVSLSHPGTAEDSPPPHPPVLCRTSRGDTPRCCLKGGVPTNQVRSPHPLAGNLLNTETAGSIRTHITYLLRFALLGSASRPCRLRRRAARACSGPSPSSLLLLR